MRRRRRILAALAPLGAFAAYNVVVYFQARAFTHFTDGGARTESPEKLTRLEKLEALLFGVRMPKFESKVTPAAFGLDFTTHRYPSRDGLELEAWHVPCRSARAFALVFHGYGAGKAAQLLVAKELHDLGVATFLVDFRGSGGSDGWETTLGIKEADDVAASVAYVASHVTSEQPILFGTSMGAAAVLRAAHVHHVAPRAAILECPFGRMLDTVKARFALMGVPSWPSAQLLVFWGGGLEGFSHEPVVFAKDLACPTLLMHGEKDPTISVAQIREIEAALPGEKELVLFPGSAHESYLPAHTRAWRAAVERLLARSGATRGRAATAVR